MKLSNVARITTAAALTAAALCLGACSSSSGTGGPSSSPGMSIGGDIIAPVTMDAGDLQGATVDLVVGQVLNINTGDLAVDSYTAKIADPKVASFSQGDPGPNPVLNPGITADAEGETAVTLTNAQGGIQPLEFTVVVTAK